MFQVDALRREYPALNHRRDGVLPVFLDGPGGTQVPQRVIDAMVHYLTTCNANHGGVFATSRESDRIIHNGIKQWPTCFTPHRPKKLSSAKT